MKDKILFIACTHGNEQTPVTAIENVIQKIGEKVFNEKCEFVIANPKAKELGVRFTETDLNRIYPGDANSPLYESRRAAELLEYAKQFKCVVDIHTTVADSEIFTLITKGKKENYELAEKLSSKKVVIWDSPPGVETGPIATFLPLALEIEASTIMPNHLEELENSILSAINYETNQITEKEWYKVIGSLSINDFSDVGTLKEFQEFTFNNEKYYPLLVNRYKDKACYLMEKIDEPA